MSDSTSVQGELDRQRFRYQAALHAVQTGVKYRIEYEEQHGEVTESSAKHLRTGVNAALIDAGALARLLLDKGIITELEYATALADQAENEQRSYESWLSARYGKHVTLA